VLRSVALAVLLTPLVPLALLPCGAVLTSFTSFTSFTSDTSDTPDVRDVDVTDTSVWRQLEPGLELGRFATRDTLPDPEGDLVILRVDPQRWELRLLTATVGAGAKHRSARMWCEEFGLVAAINAGMFQRDRRTHVGYLQVGGEVLSAHTNSYLSAVAMGPRRSGLPPFRIFDLDIVPLTEVLADYNDVAQNLRLIKRPGTNRWSVQTRRWVEAALGEDGSGRALLIYCETPYPMYLLNGLLLALPLDLVCAQHLEGGGDAQFHVAHQHFTGGFQGAADKIVSWPIPNVIGVRRR
jgi:hypothetical protein